MQPIFHAILKNDLPAFLELVEESESSLEERNEEERLNNTVLHMAAKLGHRELVSKIIELRPSLVCSRNAYGNTPLHLAAVLGDVNIVVQMLETGLEVCSARNINNHTPLNLACRSDSIEAARLIAEKTQSIGLGELNLAISRGSTRIILERFPDLAREEAWVVEDGSQSTLLHHACDKSDFELTSILLGLDQGLEEALNTKGLSPLHLAVVRGSVVILEEFLDKVPLSFSSITPSKETVFHLAARNKNMDAFVFMAESLGINSQILLQQTDESGNTVLHIAASVACDAPLIRYIVGKNIVDIMYKNKMGFEAFQLLPREAQDFELLLRWLRFGTETLQELDSENNVEHESSQEIEVIRLLRLIGINTSEIAERKRNRKWKEVNARNTIAIVAVLIASVAYAGGINPPGGVYQDGPWRGKSLVGKTTAFKVFAICNNIALFTSLCIVILLVSIIPYKRKPLKKLLVATHRMMWVSVGFMATAYIAASWVTIPHYDGTRWLFPAIIAVAGGALTVLFSYLGVETIGHWFKKMNRVGDIPSFAKTSSDLAASGISGYFTY
ncbi:ankyrin repeat family protein [Arabidopsis lyrata subsp. lyrata]|uniref:Ankyrin repeat family protein n=1 Tax=Arabidopsis lyrata subsp. lyrata TaxID=81972 RepID=D7KKP5_ARALL|nr:ankyrin repeat family protein [Arabidopsis lyrata subsp. lyrata]